MSLTGKDPEIGLGTLTGRPIRVSRRHRCSRTTGPLLFRSERGLRPRNLFLGGGFGRGAKLPSE